MLFPECPFEHRLQLFFAFFTGLQEVQARLYGLPPFQHVLLRFQVLQLLLLLCRLFFVLFKLFHCFLALFLYSGECLFDSFFVVG